MMICCGVLGTRVAEDIPQKGLWATHYYPMQDFEPGAFAKRLESSCAHRDVGSKPTDPPRVLLTFTCCTVYDTPVSRTTSHSNACV